MRLPRVAMSLLASIVLAQSVVHSVEAKPGFYSSIPEFLDTVFTAHTGEAYSLIVNARLRAEIEEILDHPFPGLRIKYWQQGETTAWVFDEIGKTEPITIGVSIDSGRVASVRVLEYRESRGGEIRHSFFTDRFLGSSLIQGSELDRSIDGITGATMSVEAMEKVVRVALFLEQRLRLAQITRERASY